MREKVEGKQEVRMRAKMLKIGRGESREKRWKSKKRRRARRQKERR